MAFVDIYDIYNRDSKYNFGTRKNEYYTALVLNLQDIHAEKYIFPYKTANDTITANDTVFANDTIIANDTIPIRDTIPSNSSVNRNDTTAANIDKSQTITKQVQQGIIGEGDIIVHLLDKDNNVVREFFINEDKEIIMDFLHPGEYTIRIIYDKNNNGKWDTGDYFMNQQAERVIMNGKAFMLKTNFENKFTWNVGKALVESCYAK